MFMMHNIVILHNGEISYAPRILSQHSSDGLSVFTGYSLLFSNYLEQAVLCEHMNGQLAIFSWC